MSIGPQDALAALHRPAREQPQGARRAALVAGCTGRLGEALLNAVLGSSAYDRVYACTRMPLESTMRKLVAADIAHPFPAVDDVYCLIAGSDHALSAASYFGRDDAFAEFTPERIPTLAGDAQALGARRFALIAPLEAYLQSAAFVDAIIDATELAVCQAGFEAIVVMRPTAAGDGARIHSGSMVERLMRWWFAQFAHMIPSSIQPVQSTRVAAAAVEALTRLAAGRRVITAQDLQRA